jgi:hypothetical protein
MAGSIWARVTLGLCGAALLVIGLSCGNVATTTTAPSGPPQPMPTAQGTPVTPVAPPAATTAKKTKPATSVEAAKVLDLSQLPLMPNADEPSHRHLAGLNYFVQAPLKEAFNFHVQQLEKLGWKEVAPNNSSDDYASAMLGKDDFLISLSVGKIDDKAMVNIVNLGNVRPASLPVPADAKQFYSDPQSALYLSEASPEDAQAAVRKLLTEDGWLPYGEAGDALFFRQNAIRLTASAGAAPAQDNKTMISYSLTLLSRELHAPTEKVEHVSYSDQPAQLTFEAQMTEEEVVEYYKKVLEPEGWKPTTEQANKIDFEKFLIFRNSAKDLMELTLRDLGEGKTRVMLEFQTAAEVAALEKRIDEEIAKKKAEANKPLPKYALALPAKAADVQADKSTIEFSVPSGTAKDAAIKIGDALKSAGWEGSFQAQEDLLGAASFSKDSQTISLDYNDTGVLPAEISIRAIGVELEVKQ